MPASHEKYVEIVLTILEHFNSFKWDSLASSIGDIRNKENNTKCARN